MPRCRRLPAVLATSLLICPPGPAASAAAQSQPELMARGIAASVALDPRSAATSFEVILSRDTLDAEANWRAALALVDIAKQTPSSVDDPVRDSLYVVAQGYARRAIRLAPSSADARFAFTMALGLWVETLRPMRQVRYVGEMYTEAVRAVELDPGHDGALHVLGRWHADVMRASGFERFMARKVLGAGVMSNASWAEAARLLEGAVSSRPDYIFHRLDLAKVYADMKRYADARTQLEMIPDLPTKDVLDPLYRHEASALLARIAGKDNDR